MAAFLPVSGTASHFSYCDPDSSQSVYIGFAWGHGKKYT